MFCRPISNEEESERLFSLSAGHNRRRIFEQGQEKCANGEGGEEGLQVWGSRRAASAPSLVPAIRSPAPSLSRLFPILPSPPSLPLQPPFTPASLPSPLFLLPSCPRLWCPPPSALCLPLRHPAPLPLPHLTRSRLLLGRWGEGRRWSQGGGGGSGYAKQPPADTRNASDNWPARGNGCHVTI